MRELSLNILDIAQNSLAANTTSLLIEIGISKAENRLAIKISDNGKGMDKNLLEKVCDPFVTSRKTRRVGLGIPLFKMSAELCGGTFDINSALNVGTTVTASMELFHIDRMPLGNIGDTLTAIIMAKPDIELTYLHTFESETFEFSTNTIREILGETKIESYEIINYLKEFINENINELQKGEVF